MPDNYHTTSQCAEILGLKPHTIRNWLSRNPDKFLLGVHVVKDDNGVNRWTEAGIEILKQLAGIESDSTPTGDDPFFDPSQDAITTHLIDIAAEVRARYILNQLPMATLQKLRSLIQEDEAVNTSLQSTIYNLTQYQLKPRGYLEATNQE